MVYSVDPNPKFSEVQPSMSYYTDPFDPANQPTQAHPPVSPVEASPGQPSFDATNQPTQAHPAIPQMGTQPPIQVPAQAVRNKKKQRWPLNRGCTVILLAIVGIFGFAACGTLIALTAAWITLSNKLGAQLALAQKNVAQTTFQTAHVYDRDGNALHELFSEGRRTNINLTDVPQSLIDATVATEDSTFYSNPGIDLGATLRATLDYVTGRSNAGGSTITQQLARDIAFDYQYRHSQSFQRKAEEIIMAVILNQRMSKNQILELYLNQIYYGNLAYGVEAAAQTYFGKHASQLTLAESALLAGLPQAPADLDPLNPDPAVQQAVQDRRKTVLNLMVSHGKLTQAQADAALTQQLTYADPSINLTYPHFTLYAEQQLRDLLGGLNLPPSILFTGGLSVYTTLSAPIQNLAQNTAQKQIATISVANQARNAAVVVIQPNTGEILGMVGSVNYNDASIQGKINMTISPRQPGSSIKPLTYSSAFEHGLTAASILWDVPIQIPIPGQPTYAPTDYDHRYRGPVRVRDALANSLNIPAVETLRTVGVPSLLEIAQRFGVRSLGTDPSKYGLSLTLGGGALTPLEEAQAYSVLANGGAFVPVTAIRCVIDGTGTILYQYEKGCSKGKPGPNTISANASPRQVLDPRIAFVLSDILADNVARSPEMGSRSPLYTGSLHTSAKTGTTNDFHDNWTMGYTRNVVVGVWVGNTDNKPMVNTTGLTGAAPIWHDVITGIYNDPTLLNAFKLPNGSLEPDALPPPSGMARKQLCDLPSLKEPAVACTPGRVEWMLASPPLVPGPDGKLAPSQTVGIAPTQAPQNGPRPTAIEPDILQEAVFQLNPALAAGLVQPGPNGQAPPPPLYCEIPNEVRQQVPTALTQLFIRAPTFADEAIAAHVYAQSAGIPIEPQLICNGQMLSSKPGATNVVAQITSPTPGQTVTGTVAVAGVVSFSPQQATYYKVEIQGPQFADWTTIGSTHNQSANGELEHFGAQGLKPGTYQLRITIVGLDGNYLTSTPGVPIQITGQ